MDKQTFEIEDINDKFIKVDSSQGRDDKFWWKPRTRETAIHQDADEPLIIVARNRQSLNKQVSSGPKLHIDDCPLDEDFWEVDPSTNIRFTVPLTPEEEEALFDARAKAREKARLRESLKTPEQKELERKAKAETKVLVQRKKREMRELQKKRKEAEIARRKAAREARKQAREFSRRCRPVKN